MGTPSLFAPDLRRLNLRPPEAIWLGFLNLWFIGLSFWLVSCASGPPTPVFQGVAQELPTATTRLLVYVPNLHERGVESEIAEHEAIMWFQRRGFTVIERSRIEEVIQEQRLTMRIGDDTTVLKAGRILGAQHLVVLNVGFDRVAFRSLDIETGRILWSGLGYYPDRLYIPTDRSEQVSPLVRRTLDTVWASSK